ncbi:MAG: hypothetical protein R2695_19265 [Acidimicrobiales bacterium]
MPDPAPVITTTLSAKESNEPMPPSSGPAPAGTLPTTMYDLILVRHGREWNELNPVHRVVRLPPDRQGPRRGPPRPAVD